MIWQNHIIHDPAICKGRATVAGTRIMVSVVLDNIADGLSIDDVARDYPPLTADQIKACLAYAAWLAHDEVVALPEPSAA
jgi:uncharacterized protein (DUF433 family)